MKTERYIHHGVEVTVFTELKGRHRDHCLCYANCAHFKPGTSENCPIAQENYALCVKHGITTPVFECPRYQSCEKH